MNRHDVRCSFFHAILFSDYYHSHCVWRRSCHWLRLTCVCWVRNSSKSYVYLLHFTNPGWFKGHCESPNDLWGIHLNKLVSDALIFHLSEWWKKYSDPLLLVKVLIPRYENSLPQVLHSKPYLSIISKTYLKYQKYSLYSQLVLVSIHYYIWYFGVNIQFTFMIFGRLPYPEWHTVLC